eukprot:290221-Chlamydomonas_euryale.AAC.2
MCVGAASNSGILSGFQGCHSCAWAAAPQNACLMYTVHSTLHSLQYATHETAVCHECEFLRICRNPVRTGATRAAFARARSKKRPRTLSWEHSRWWL